MRGLNREDREKLERKKDRMIAEASEWSRKGRSIYSLKELGDEYEMSAHTCKKVMVAMDIEPKGIEYSKPANPGVWSDNQPRMTPAAQKVNKLMNRWARCAT